MEEFATAIGADDQVAFVGAGHDRPVVLDDLSGDDLLIGRDGRGNLRSVLRGGERRCQNRAEENLDSDLSDSPFPDSHLSLRLLPKIAKAHTTPV